MRHTKTIIMYSMYELMGDQVTGGMKRFLELYRGLLQKEADVILYSPEKEASGFDGKQVIRLNPLKKKKGLPIGLCFAWNNYASVRKIRKNREAKVVVFDVPTAIGLVPFWIRHMVLFIRQDLVETRRSLFEGKRAWKWHIRYWSLLLSESLCFLQAEKIVTQCKKDAYEIKKRHVLLRRIIEDKLCIQINNVNASWMVPVSGQRIEDRHGYRIGFVGSVGDTKKGLLQLLKAVDIYRKKYGAITLYVIGDGSLLEDYKNEYSSEDTIFFGYVSKPMELIVNCDLFVAPSLTDSCPNTVLEAFYHNIPVIGSNRGGIPELLQNREAVFEPEENEIAAMLYDYRDPERRAALMDRQAKRKKQLTFDWAGALLDIL
ncbi:MAG: glycosyltransferase family 4 protein [Clostridium sp.]|jgi:glycosyltransferase involved in cell wall biosynthesis|nr:glycosyltransferase family 4 protein [Clostridium sp.]